MKLLAIDTSTETLSVAVGDGAGECLSFTGPGGASASTTLIPQVLRLLAEAGWSLGLLDAIAFGAGPGSFTGLRTACSVAQGLAFGADVPVLPADTLQVVAEEARTATGASRVHAVLDARMDEVYAAAWAWQSGVWTATGEATLGKPEQLVVEAGVVMAGNAFAAYGQRLERIGSLRQVALPAASAMLRLAPALWAAGCAVPAAQAMPHYIRDKVAKTTAERLAEQAAVAAPGAPA